MRNLAALALVALLGVPATVHAIAVDSTTPGGNANNVSRNASIVIRFDRAVDAASIDNASLRIWGQQSGRVAGTIAYSNGGATLTFTPSVQYFPGEWITVQLSHDVAGADATRLRAAGYVFQFVARTAPAAMTFTQNGPPVSVRTSGDVTRLYGGAVTDLDNDGWVDFVAINEISADLRVLLNTADGTGHLGPVLTPPSAIGVEASPSTVADFDNDGFMDVATGNSTSSTASIALGSGDGRFMSVQNVDVGDRPHGIVALDVDGDGDLDLVVASEYGGALSLLINDGSGHFGGRTDFDDTDGDCKYALGAGDMNGDGILDLVVGTCTQDRIHVLAGNGDGTFTATEDIDSGGYSWKLTLGDVDNDGNLDVAQANGFDNNAVILLGNGDGTLQAADIYGIPGSGAGSSLGDIDGDGDLDWVISSYSAGQWYVFENDGTGAFDRVGTIPAPSNASCASLYDFDNNGTLDMALADETADVILLEKNDGAAGTDFIFLDGFDG
ncbi:MAG TPA: FG-GAP-like repeat-containing protein [Rhodanobacteraceae bacterium]|nr:FG-GAP-like repeat-containing protein [Rhodanobacteraceae bacterium]